MVWRAECEGFMEDRGVSVVVGWRTTEGRRQRQLARVETERGVVEDTHPQRVAVERGP